MASVAQMGDLGRMTQGLLSPMSAYFEGPQCFFGPGQSQGLHMRSAR